MASTSMLAGALPVVVLFTSIVPLPQYSGLHLHNSEFGIEMKV
jgi:hypothetical protein